jgi:hypothetical protein
MDYSVTVFLIMFIPEQIYRLGYILHYIPVDKIFHSHRYENLSSYMCIPIFCHYSSFLHPTVLQLPISLWIFLSFLSKIYFQTLVSSHSVSPHSILP